MAPQREWFDKDYYKVLGVAATATDKEITKAYRKLAKENHPDSHPGREDRFKEISAANTVLSDVDQRREYDEVRRMGPGAFGLGGGGRGAGGGAGGAGFPSDLNDLLGGLFNQGGARTRARNPRRGADLETSLAITFDDAVNGIVTKVEVMTDGPCEPCDATGASPGTRPSLCSTCGGRGSVDQNQGFFSFSQPCTTCQGTGMKIDHPCIYCKGTGNQRKARTVNVRIPAGVEDGQRIRLKGRGGAGLNGGQPGDLKVTVSVGRHAMFGRKGSDLTITVPVTIAEAVLGATLAVPTLHGSVNMRLPAGTKPGRVMRVKGKGAPMKGGDGDLLVTFDVVIPTELSDEQRAAVEALAAVSSGAALRTHLGV
jgi:molecular chaperone DnaJ